MPTRGLAQILQGIQDGKCTKVIAGALDAHPWTVRQAIIYTDSFRCYRRIRDSIRSQNRSKTNLRPSWFSFLKSLFMACFDRLKEKRVNLWTGC